MQALLQDIRYGLRVLLRARGSSAVAVIALALGIGANTAIFSLVEAVLLRPLPYADADRLVQVWEDASFAGFPRNTPAPGNFFSWKERNHVFEDMAASRNRSVTLTGDGDPEAVEGRGVTANIFSVLGTRPLLGRTFTADEDRPEAAPTVVLSYRLWQRRYGGDAGVVGRSIEVVTPGYHHTMGIPLRAGRLLDARDREGAQLVLVVNEAFVRAFFPGEDPLGRRIARGPDEPWVTIVGVVGDVKQMGLEKGARAEMYWPLAQYKSDGSSPRDLVVRLAGDGEPMALAEALRKAIWEIDPRQPVANVRPMTDILDAEVASRNVQASMLGAFATLALVLAALGMYGVLSYAVAQRRREIGIRMALGAPAAEVVRMVVGQGMKLCGAGLVIGLGLALVAMRVLSAMLYGVSASDPLTYVVVAVVLGGVAAVASYLPARHAARLDPLIALQAD